MSDPNSELNYLLEHADAIKQKALAVQESKQMDDETAKHFRDYEKKAASYMLTHGQTLLSVVANIRKAFNAVEE
ncbi:MAG: hypothetical protein MHM6MM_005716 [Cercozoa sp. M6MM]